MSKIKHSGIIEAVLSDHLVVRILQVSACAACHAKHHCSASEKKEKLVDVFMYDSDKEYKVGDTVVVTASTSVGMRAVIYAFTLPFIIMVSVVFIAMWLVGSEGFAAAMAILSVIVYYVVLYFFRGAMREALSFAVE